MNKDTENTGTTVSNPKEFVLGVCGNVTVTPPTLRKVTVNIENLVKAAADWHDEHYLSDGIEDLENSFWRLMEKIIREVEHGEKSD